MEAKYYCYTITNENRKFSGYSKTKAPKKLSQLRQEVTRGNKCFGAVELIDQNATIEQVGDEALILSECKVFVNICKDLGHIVAVQKTKNPDYYKNYYLQHKKY